MNQDAFIGGLIGGLAGVGVFVLFTHLLALATQQRREQQIRAGEMAGREFWQ